jgi:hypothetical protein
MYAEGKAFLVYLALYGLTYGFYRPSYVRYCLAFANGDVLDSKYCGQRT